ncbi:MAG: arginine--tRNA ligase [Candidatus Portnoybacteria bacterium CG_4_10_14_0_2_um_filter_39_11]|uniref:Arginine--tRNA ligase n=1 Tax=Candidatus Portnoybacteria bacterium CG_4_10_14_0_2_um_filter_39_11 TaxID=1974797 RepID=A0A2M7UI79_9BACT|nr:MAG: arginine--tRNA ligase [Candidatus Portnoybacteria bacterium CG_4_10_14_0_2_um_filter_39_11]
MYSGRLGSLEMTKKLILEFCSYHMILIREQIKNLVNKAYKKAQDRKRLPEFVMPEITVEHPAQKEFGDYATNAPLVTGAIANIPPLNIAESVVLEIEEDMEMNELKKSLIERIKIQKPGFLNFYLKSEFLQGEAQKILDQKENFGSINIGQGKKVQVEFVSANPTGPLSVGNARGGPWGDVLANVLRKAGYKVEKAYYVNDYGQQILALGHSVLKDEEAVYKGGYIDDLHQKIKEQDSFKAGQQASKIILDDYIKKTLENIGIKFDQWYFESDVYNSGFVDVALSHLKDQNLLKEKDGAIWFLSSKFGDIRDRVVIKTDGQKTYLAGDLGFHWRKFQQEKFDKVINVWGADHSGDAPGLKAGIDALGFKDKLEFVILQFVTLFSKGKKVKMSKRAGNIVTLQELLDEVGKDAVRFFFLQRSANTHLDFDLNLAKEQSNKNPVYYIQYAYARICSVLRKVVATDQAVTINQTRITESERDLICQLVRLPEIIADTARDYQAQRLPHHASELAASFHCFYHDCRVLGNEDPSIDQARLALVRATQIVLKNTLDLMGITAPEKM